MKRNVSWMILAMLVFTVGTAFGQVPKTLSYQGVLTDSSGNSLPDGQYQMFLSIFEQSSGGVSSWDELQTVTVENGVFSAILGSVTPFNLAFDKPYWLEIEVNGDVLSPRTELTATAYSLNTANIPDSIVSGAKIADGQVVRRINGLADEINLAAGANVSITPQGDSLVIAASGGGGSSPWSVAGNNVHYNLGNVGIGTNNPTALLHTVGSGNIPSFLSGSSSADLAVPDNQPLQFGHWNGSGSSFTERMRVTNTGDVGIGTSTPGIFPDAYRYLTVSASQFYIANRTAALELQGSSIGGGVPVGRIDFGSVDNTGNTGNIARIHAEGGSNLATTGELVFFTNNGTSLNEAFRVLENGNVGIGTSNPGAVLDVAGNVDITRNTNGTALDIQHSGTLTNTLVNIETSAGPPIFTNLMEIKAGDSMAPDAQFIECARGTDVEFRVNGDGDVTADGAFTGGGADFAEMMEVSSGASSVEAGDVLVIDPNNLRAIIKSTQARSTLAAGIYSSKPGFVGSERDMDRIAGEIGTYSRAEMASVFNEVPLAVVGIVPCKVSAENGSIRPGDLLVTSSTPGHAMRDEDPRNGTVLGKALGSLSSGTGVIKVLVTLQ